jgi:S1-C subfamily serine protease
MDKRMWKVIGLLAALALVFVIGAAAGGGIVFAANQGSNPDGKLALLPDQDDGEPGVVIASVDPDGPAAEAGVKRGDILLKIDEQAVNHSQDLIGYLQNLKVGDQVELTVLHGDEQRTLTVVLGDRETRPYLGLTPCFGLPAEINLRMAGPGARITKVVSDSPADKAGLKVGDLITSVDGQTLDGETNLADLIAKHTPGDSLTLEVQSPGQEAREVSVELGEHPEQAGKPYLGVEYLPAPGSYRFEGRPMPFGGSQPGMRTPDENFRFALPEDLEGGAAVVRVADDGPAKAAGLQRGDIITAVDGQAVDSPKAVTDAVADHEPGDVLKLSVYRPEADDTLELEVTLAEHPEQKDTAYLGVQLSGIKTSGFEGQQGAPMPGNRSRGFEFRLPFNRDDLPFDFGGKSNRSLPETPPNNCCGNDFSSEI